MHALDQTHNRCVSADPGFFEFEKPSFLVKESVGLAQIPVSRVNGCDGKVTLTWKTEDVTALSGKDYEGGEGTIVFEHGETAKMIEIPIRNDLVKYTEHVVRIVAQKGCGGCILLPTRE
jgi:solute carrier family 8 (sodium/calcium exchanger)